MQTYYALVHKDDDSAFGISFPDLPGCFAASDSEDDIFASAQEALSLYASGGAAMPAGRSLSKLLRDPEVASEIASGAFLIAIPFISVGKKARYNLMLARDLVEGLDRTASALGQSRSDFVADAIVRRLKSHSGAVVRESTGKKGSSAASKVLKSKTASKEAKSVAASALTQKTKKA